MAAKPNFYLKAVAKEDGRREDIAGGFCWSEKGKDRERENGRKGLEENHDEEVKNVKNKDEVHKEHVNCDQRILREFFYNII